MGGWPSLEAMFSKVSVAAVHPACLCLCFGAISPIPLKPALKSHPPDHPLRPQRLCLLLGATVTEMPPKDGHIHMFSPDTSDIFKMGLQPIHESVRPSPVSAHSDHESSALVGPLFLDHSCGICLLHRSQRAPLLMSHFGPSWPPFSCSISCSARLDQHQGCSCSILSQFATLAVCSDFYGRLRAAGPSTRIQSGQDTDLPAERSSGEGQNGQENGHNRAEKLIPDTQIASRKIKSSRLKWTLGKN